MCSCHILILILIVFTQFLRTFNTKNVFFIELLHKASPILSHLYYSCVDKSFEKECRPVFLFSCIKCTLLSTKNYRKLFKNAITFFVDGSGRAKKLRLNIKKITSSQSYIVNNKKVMSFFIHA